MRCREFISYVINRICGKDDSMETYQKRGVKIGKNVDIYNSFIDGGHGFLVEIGDNVTITNAAILAHDASTKKFLGYTKVGKVKIGNNVFVGYGSIILPNVRIGNDVVIGAGTVVREDIPDNCVVIGNPAKIICSTDAYIGRNKEKMKEVPVYHTTWKEKSMDEKHRMIEELECTMGFDI